MVHIILPSKQRNNMLVRSDHFLKQHGEDRHCLCSFRHGAGSAGEEGLGLLEDVFAEADCAGDIAGAGFVDGY